MAVIACCAVLGYIVGGPYGFFIGLIVGVIFSNEG